MERIAILKMGEFLLVTIQVDMHDRLAIQLQDDLSGMICKHRSRGVLIDISALEMVDSFIGRMLANIASVSCAPPSTSRRGWRCCAPPAWRTAEPSMSTISERETHELRSEEQVVKARQLARKWVAGLGFSLVEQTKFVTAVSELARNTLIHGGGGVLELEILQEGRMRKLRMTFRDQGPGIPDINAALRDGFTTGSGLGLGLGGARRLVHEFELESQPGAGTRVVIATRWK
jgi:serine/threonine-protein kinase RsbT